MIQWFPGHMFKARKAFQERLPDTDVVIEVTDARLPRSSSNPMLETLVLGRKPLLKILNKQDLADVEMTQAWLNWFCAHEQTDAIALSCREKNVAKKILQAARALAPHRASADKPLRLMICGVPNVGKSTLLNALVGQKLAKTGNEPAITKVEQRIDLDEFTILWDTPGMLWEKIEHEFCGDMLAASGAIGRNAFEASAVCLSLLEVLSSRYGEALKTRYRLPHLEFQPFDLFEEIGRKMGMVRSGGRVDEQKTAERLLTDFREGRLGGISLETPDDWIHIAAEIEHSRQLDEQKKALRRQKKSRRLQQLDGEDEGISEHEN